MIIIDIEASSLRANSYPIEIGWVHNLDSTRFDHFLIRPHAHWTDWDYDAQAIHAITRSELFARGIEVGEAIDRLAPLVREGAVFSDRPGSDKGWLNTLYYERGFPKAPINVRPITSLLPPSKVEAFWRRLGATMPQHRALDDAVRISKTLNYFSSC